MATHWHLVTTPALITEETWEQDHVIHCTDWSLRGNTLNGDGPASNFQFPRNNCYHHLASLTSPHCCHQTSLCTVLGLTCGYLHCTGQWSVVSCQRDMCPGRELGGDWAQCDVSVSSAHCAAVVLWCCGSAHHHNNNTNTGSATSQPHMAVLDISSVDNIAQLL